ncbi:thiamine phosphate synthase [Hymenobacter sp. H14-R3]|uniref:thiamine phosphate synthase n=1 Tax=Hymenobacter sp. H14-R3 TaxID=3046308 RepID=UPI0024BB59CD|nr:thiamine phosphate synthase [Hymenobacter sp. H14-R3]MDJ0366240.1 thiamine phosphate synthase [Hymenobacter sp. H14-R3]
MFRLLLITAPTALPHEPRLLTELLALGLPRLHLRKPGWPASQVAALIEALPPQFRARLVLHGHPELVRGYRLGGLHLTAAGRLAAARRPALLPGQTLSTSFHSLAEISQHRRRYDYVFLSPIFDSISKAGYGSAFDLAVVRAFLQKTACRTGYCPQVLALGGVDSQNVSLTKEAGFAGAAVLGDVWGSADPVAAFQRLAQEVTAEVRRGNR